MAIPNPDSSIIDLYPIIFNNAFDAIVVYETIRGDNGEVIDFTFRHMNDSSFKILTGSRKDYIGKRFLTLFPYAVEDGMFDTFKSVSETGISAEKVFYYDYGEYRGWYRDSVFRHGDGIIVYFKDITETKELELKLKKTIKEKELLLKEIHHRVKNNLQVVSSVINLQTLYIKDAADVPLFLESQNRIKAIALIHKKLYEEDALSSINFENYIRDLIINLFTTYQVKKGKITLIYDIDNIETGSDSAINLGLILNELISNALKYAFPDELTGELKISVKAGSDIVTVTVEDNGTGFPENIDFRNSDTLGLQLVNSLVAQYDGKIELDSLNGTKFILTFGRDMLKNK
ncbi:MAG: histidine kinase dimerization/phosphoacceptor domain -containing protein [Ignavibacteriaceae bacterium]|nr:histidine kinase dimerization/phosphoacceptor domain -containing protein [Ignavibacteriaceae bacterium]